MRKHDQNILASSTALQCGYLWSLGALINFAHSHHSQMLIFGRYECHELIYLSIKASQLI